VNIIRPSDREIVADAWNINAAQMSDIIDDLIASEGLSSSEEIELGNEIAVSPIPSTNFLQINTNLDLQGK